MRRFSFKKLIRDKILDQQLAEGSKPEYRILSKREHLDELVKKLGEEGREIAMAAPGAAASEIADVQQVLDDIKALLGVDPSEVRREQARKNRKYGAFQKGIFVEYIDIDESNPWVAHYRENADRYPEIAPES